MIRILYFARVRERLACSEESIDLPAGVSSLGGLRQWLQLRGEVWEEVLGTDAQVLMARNQEMAGADALLADGDEVAFFPPVTGG